MSRTEDLVLALVNEQRRGAGVRPLKKSRWLRLAAAAHAKDMAARDYFSHPSADGTPWWRRVERIIGTRRFDSIGENLARGQDTPSEVVIAWMRSPEHRANILADKYTHMGLAIARRGDEEYWVQEFGGR